MRSAPNTSRNRQAVNVGRPRDRPARPACQRQLPWAFPGEPALALLGLTYARKGMHAEAIRAAQRAIEVAPERTEFLGDLAYVQALGGDTASARQTLRLAKVQPREPFTVARAYVALQEPDSAFVWLDRSSWLWPHRAAVIDPALDPLRSDPRFARLSDRIERERGLR